MIRGGKNLINGSFREVVVGDDGIPIVGATEVVVMDQELNSTAAATTATRTNDVEQQAPQAVVMDQELASNLRHGTRTSTSTNTGTTKPGATRQAPSSDPENLLPARVDPDNVNADNRNDYNSDAESMTTPEAGSSSSVDSPHTPPTATAVHAFLVNYDEEQPTSQQSATNSALQPVQYPVVIAEPLRKWVCCWDKLQIKPNKWRYAAGFVLFTIFGAVLVTVAIMLTGNSRGGDTDLNISTSTNDGGTSPDTPLQTLAPTSSEQCDIDIQATACLVRSNVNGTSVLNPCDSIRPFTPRCTSAISELTIRYTGLSCGSSFNIQPPDLFRCYDYQTAASESQHHYLVARDAYDENRIFFQGWVSIGQYVTLGTTAGEDQTIDFLNVTVYSGNATSDTPPEITPNLNIRQSYFMIIDCSRNFFLGDKFGSGQISGFVSKADGNVSAFREATVTFEINSIDAETANRTDVLDFRVLRADDEEIIPLSPQQQDGGNATTTTRVVEYSFPFDTSISQNQLISASVTGQVVGGRKCTSNTDYSFVHNGNAYPTLPPSLPTACKNGLEIKCDGGVGNGFGPIDCSEAELLCVSGGGFLSSITFKTTLETCEQAAVASADNTISDALLSCEDIEPLEKEYVTTLRIQGSEEGDIFFEGGTGEGSMLVAENNNVGFPEITSVILANNPIQIYQRMDIKTGCNDLSVGMKLGMLQVSALTYCLE